MSRIFAIGPVSPEAFTVWTIDDGVVLEVEDSDIAPPFEPTAEAA